MRSGLQLEPPYARILPSLRSCSRRIVLVFGEHGEVSRANPGQQSGPGAQKPADPCRPSARAIQRRLLAKARGPCRTTDKNVLNAEFDLGRRRLVHQQRRTLERDAGAGAPRARSRKHPALLAAEVRRLTLGDLPFPFGLLLGHLGVEGSGIGLCLSGSDRAHRAHGRAGQAGYCSDLCQSSHRQSLA